MSQEHSPEPWVFRNWLGRWVVGHSPCGFSGDAAFVAQTAESEANARRIVACVNACEPIGTEALEAGFVVKMLECYHALVRHMRLTKLPYPDDMTPFFELQAIMDSQAETAPSDKARQSRQE